MAAALGVTAGLVLSTSSPAQAWSGDAGVTVDGFATCDTGTWAAETPAQAVWIDLADTGDIEQVSVDQLTQYFEVRFNDVPSSGSWADVWIYCAPPGVEPGWRFAYSAWVSRPWIGTTALPLWVEA